MVEVLDPGVKPAPWGFDPGLVAPDWAWFVDGALVLSPMWEGGGVTISDLTGRSDGTLTAGTAWEDGEGASLRMVRGSGDAVDYGDLAAFQLPVYTWFLIFEADAAPGGAFNSQPLENGQAEQFGFSWDHTNAAFQQAAIHNDGAAWVNAKIQSTLKAKTVYCIHGRYDGSSLSVALNGEIEQTTTGNAPRIRTGVLRINRPTVELTCNIYAFGLFDRAWSDAQIHQFGADYYGPFRHRAEFVGWRVPAAGGTTIVPHMMQYLAA